jgi:hypothetical protein
MAAQAGQQQQQQAMVQAKAAQGAQVVKAALKAGAAVAKAGVNAAIAKFAGRLGVQFGQGNAMAASVARVLVFTQAREDDMRDINTHVRNDEYPDDYINYVRRQLNGDHLIRSWLRTLAKNTFNEHVKLVDQGPQSFHKRAIMDAYSSVRLSTLDLFRFQLRSIPFGCSTVDLLPAKYTMPSPPPFMLVASLFIIFIVCQSGVHVGTRRR